MKPFLIVFLSTFVSSLPAQDLVMRLSHSQTNGNQVVYDVSADHFVDMVAMQYTVTYQTDKLTFVTFQNFNLPDMDENDFNPAEPGIIRTAWLQNSLEGVTLDNGTVLYQIVFELQGSSTGNVCFSEDPLVYEFVTIPIALAFFFILDDCHIDPYEINLTTSVDDIADRYGMYINTAASARSVGFRLERPLRLAFRIHDTAGKIIVAFPENVWPAGPHGLYLRSQVLTSGIYILAVEIDGWPLAVKIYVDN